MGKKKGKKKEINRGRKTKRKGERKGNEIKKGEGGKMEGTEEEKQIGEITGLYIKNVYRFFLLSFLLLRLVYNQISIKLKETKEKICKWKQHRRKK